MSEGSTPTIIDADTTHASEVATPSSAAREPRGTVIGRYLIISRLGAGAMGVVYSAFDPQLDRKIALKLLKHRGPLAASRKRLQREAQALAKLDHPNVVAVYDVGVHDEQLFVAMEFVEGQTLGAWMQELDRSWSQVVEVFIAAGRGLAAAHDAKLVHRDFKPDNVMIRSDGVVRVMDFGLARVNHDEPDQADDSPDEPIDHASSIDDRLTRTGALLGTPAYMSYEQFEGHVDARSDQFSFCVALYEALYGERPFDAHTVGELLYAVEIGRIREAPRDTRVPGWLRAVLLRGLARDPAHRFPSMDELLDALAADPVARQRRTLTRTAIGLGLIASVVGLVMLSSRLDERDETIRKQDGELAQQNEMLLERQLQLVTELDVQRGLRASMLAQRPGHELEAIALALEGFTTRGQGTPEIPAPVFEGLAAAVMSLDRGLALPHDNKVSAVAFSPDGRTLATTSWDHSIRLWDTSTGRAGLSLVVPERVYSVAFSPDGTQLLTAAKDGNVRLWDATTGQQRQSFEHPAMAREAVFSPDGSRIASACSDGYARVWSRDSAQPQHVLEHGSPLWSVAFTPDGTRLISAADDGNAELWDLRGSSVTEPVATFAHEGAVLDLSVSPDGRTLATASADRSARLWDLQRNAPAAVFEHAEVVKSVAFAPDGQRLATGTWENGVAWLWDLRSAEFTASYVHGGVVTDLAFSADGHQLATASWDHTARLWNTRPGRAITPLTGHGRRVDAIATSSDGRLVATASGDNTVRVWDARTGAERVVLGGPRLDLTTVAFSPDGSQLVAAGFDAAVHLWDADTGDTLATLPGHEGRIHAASFSPDGSMIATASADQSVRVWDVASRSQRNLLAHPTPVTGVTFSPDGAHLLTLGQDGIVRAFAPETVAPLPLFDPGRPITALAWSPDGSRVALAQADNFRVRSWSLASGQPLVDFEGHTEPIHALAFSPDGTRLASAGADAMARVWEADHGRAVAGFVHAEPVLAVAWADGGGRLATADGTRQPQLWALDPTPWVDWGCTLLDLRDAHTEGSTAACLRSPGPTTSSPKLANSSPVHASTPPQTDGTAPSPPDTITIEGIELVRIPGGTFMMGSPLDEVGRFPDEGPRHEVHLDTFYLARTEVTHAQYARYLEATDAPRPKQWGWEQYSQPDQPVVGISWPEAMAFCDWAGLVLPTEAQWEYAARAGTTTRYWLGDREEDLERTGWSGNSHDRTHCVARKDPNPFGLYDIHGNVFEWCLDATAGYTVEPRPGDGLRRRSNDPTIDGVLRGGSWDQDRRYARSAYRWLRFRGVRMGDAGFRPAYTPHDGS